MDLMSRRRALLAIKSGSPIPPAPEGYQLVEWIEGTGTQWINTGITSNADHGYYVVAAPTMSAVNNNLIGVINWSFNQGLYLGCSNLSLFSLYSARYNYGDVSIDQVLTLSLNYKNDKKFVVNGSETSVTSGKIVEFPIMLFNARRSATANLGGGHWRVYDVIITEQSNVVMHLIPCKRNFDNAVGMYDSVSDTFFENSGTGVFTAGPDIN